MNSNSVGIMQIEECLEAVYTAFCIGCGAEKSDSTNESVFAKKVYELGWRCSDTGDLYCPECAKKRKIC